MNKKSTDSHEPALRKIYYYEKHILIDAKLAYFSVNTKN